MTLRSAVSEGVEDWRLSRQLVLERVSVVYGRQVVLRSISVAPVPGQLLAITGPSGAGKSTLLWVMAGLVPPNDGSIVLDGVPLRGREQAIARRVALIPQDNGLAPILTAAENIMVALVANGVKAPEARRRTDEALQLLGLAGQAQQLVEELSGGQQQRTAVARALALRPSLLLADEVTSELDAQNRQLVLELLRLEAARGVAVLLATHDPLAAAVCDNELRLTDGEAEYVR